MISFTCIRNSGFCLLRPSGPFCPSGPSIAKLILAIHIFFQNPLTSIQLDFRQQGAVDSACSLSLEDVDPDRVGRFASQRDGDLVRLVVPHGIGFSIDHGIAVDQIAVDRVENQFFTAGQSSQSSASSPWPSCSAW